MGARRRERWGGLVMQAYTVEIRDRMTFIAAVALVVSSEVPDERDAYLLRRMGFGPTPMVLLIRLGGAAHYDAFAWGDRTMQTAHQWMAQHIDELSPGLVVDVEYILGETAEPKRSEAHVR